MNGLENPGVLDAFAHDTRADKLVLAMYEDRSWSGEEIQLFQLQEKLNAYLSFILDGELNEAYPELASKHVEIQLRTVHEPDAKAFDLIRRVREQLDLQRISFEVVRIDGCGESGCGCL
jgi:formylmethanofuran dehydrogenase subunit E